MEVLRFFRLFSSLPHYLFFRRGLALTLMSFVHLFLFAFLREGILPAAIYSYFGAYAVAYGLRWAAVWIPLLGVGLFLRGPLAANVAALVFLVSFFVLPFFWARGDLWARVKFWFFYVLDIYASQLALYLLSPPWRALVGHPFTFIGYGPAAPTPVDAPWYFLGYYLWERVHHLYKRPRSLKNLLKPEFLP